MTGGFLSLDEFEEHNLVFEDNKYYNISYFFLSTMISWKTKEKESLIEVVAFQPEAVGSPYFEIFPSTGGGTNLIIYIIILLTDLLHNII